METRTTTITGEGYSELEPFLRAKHPNTLERTVIFPEGTSLITTDENKIMNPYSVDCFGLLSLAGFGKYYPETVIGDRNWVVYL